MGLVYFIEENGEIVIKPWDGDLDKLPIDKNGNYAGATSTECIEEITKILKENE